LRALLGAPTTTGSSDYTHVFETAAQPTVALVTNGIDYTDIGAHLVQDSVAYTGFEISAQKTGPRQRMTFNVVGREEVSGVATLDATPVEYLPESVPNGFKAKLLIDDVEAAGATGVSLTLGAGVEPDQETLNGLPTAAGMDWGNWDLTGSFDLRFSDLTYYNLADSGTAFKLELDYTISATQSLVFEVPSVRLERTGYPINGRGIISSSFNFRANRPTGSNTLMTATLKNGIAGYANPT
jgi:hypothetical protein